MEKMTVDEFVQTRVKPEFQPIVRAIRELMKECAPNVQEVYSYGLPMFKGKQLLAFISPSKKDITFSFVQGTQFKDMYGLLRGVGKEARHVKIKNLDDVNKYALCYYIQQAQELDEQ
jgi:hypothetical protein